MPTLMIVGGGLAGCEAAWQAAERGIDVLLFEMRPNVSTGVHRSERLAELVCSNSLGSRLIDRATGLLQEEVRRMGSLLMRCADLCSVPAGGALAVDREQFAQQVTDLIRAHPRIKLIREEVVDIPDQPVIIASGPLTSTNLSNSISRLTGHDHLYFYDAIAPVVTSESIDMSVAFRASRYDRGELDTGDYINCPFTREKYEKFVDALMSAERIALREFEKEIENGVLAGAKRFFEGCLPVETLVYRGRDALAFGPMRPVGLKDPRSGRRPYAVVQLRQDNIAGTLYNLVGFQTNLKFLEQRRVFRMIPGLENAEFARYGQMHRNTFINSPLHLKPSLQFRGRDDLLFAGQITGVEGYVGNIATGLLAGINAARFLLNHDSLILPETTMLGALCHYITASSPQDYQPMKANFGLLPALDNGQRIKGKRLRAEAYSKRALNGIQVFLEKNGITDISRVN